MDAGCLPGGRNQDIWGWGWSGHKKPVCLHCSQHLTSPCKEMLATCHWFAAEEQNCWQQLPGPLCPVAAGIVPPQQNLLCVSPAPHPMFLVGPFQTSTCQ